MTIWNRSIFSFTPLSIFLLRYAYGFFYIFIYTGVWLHLGEYPLCICYIVVKREPKTLNDERKQIQSFLRTYSMENISCCFHEHGGRMWEEFLENHILHRFGLDFHFFFPNRKCYFSSSQIWGCFFFLNPNKLKSSPWAQSRVPMPGL